MFKLRTALGLALWGVTLSSATLAQTNITEKSAWATLETGANHTIDDLVLDAVHMPVHTENGSVFIIVSGRLTKPESSLIGYGVILVKAGAALRSFSVRVPLAYEDSTFSLTAIDPRGVTQVQLIRVIVSGWDKIAQKESVKKIDRFHLNAALGLSFTSYEETQFQHLSEVALTPKVSGDFTLSRDWGIGVSSSITAFPLSSNIPGVTLRFFTFDARLGTRLPWLPDPWSVRILFGGYYETTLTSGASFGFSNMTGPELYPILERRLSNRENGNIHLRYATILSKGVNLSSYSFGGGLSFGRALTNGHQLLCSFDYNRENLELSNLFSIQANAMTLSLGYSF